MNQIKIILPLFFSFLFAAAYASNPVQPKNFQKKGWYFAENKGQLVDPSGKGTNDIRYYGHLDGVSMYCRLDRIGFIVSQKTGETPGTTDIRGFKNKMSIYREKKSLPDEKINYYGAELIFKNANNNAVIIPGDPQEYYENFYTANTGEKGITGVRTFKTIRYQDIYNHIDLMLHIRDNGLKYEFILHPGANVNNIELEWRGTDHISLLQNGGISYKIGPCTFNESAPVSFLTDGKKVESSFSKKGNNLRFNVGKYDPAQTLTIDPYLTWGTYLGGSGDEWAQTICRDNAGNILIVGPTTSSSSIATSGAFRTSYSGNNDAFVSKFSSSGSMLWSTYYGGTAYDDGYGIAIDKYNNVFFTGATSSTSGIATSGAYQSSYKGTGKGSSNAYLVKLSPGGGRFWATYFGGASYDYGDYVTLDASQNIYLDCQVSSTSGIASSGAFQTSMGGTQDESITKYDSTGKLSWSTYYGGSDYEYPGTLYIDVSGNVITTGTTASSSGIATSGAYQSSINGGYDGYLASFSSSGGLNWATYYGGFDDELITEGLTGDGSGNIFLAGGSYSTSRIATTGAYQTSNAGSLDAFVSKFTSAGKLSWGTFYGGSGDESLNAIGLDGSGNIFITGGTYGSGNMYTSGAYQSSNAGSYDAFISKFNSSGSLAYSSYYGGADDDAGYSLALDISNGSLYVGGYTVSTSGIATSGSYQTSSGGSSDVLLSDFSFKIYATDAGISKIISPGTTLCTGTKPVKVQLYNYGTFDIKSVTIGWSINKKVQTSYSWTGTLKKDSAVTLTLGSYSFTPGVDTIITWTTKPNGAADSFPQNDTARVIDSVASYPKSGLAGGNKSVCPGSGVTLGSSTISGVKYSWTSKPSGFTSTSASIVVTPSASTIYYLTVTNPSGGCSTLDSSVVTVYTAPTANAGGNHTICYGGSYTIGTTATKNHIYTWSSVPVGFTSKLSNPTVNPTQTTTYYVTETDTLTGCFAYDNGTITVSPPAKANAGGNHTICSGSSIILGASAVSGHTYSWKSKPVGFTSTVSNPTVNPIVATVYYLTDVITATGCTALDSAAISIIPLPSPNAGGNKSICSGNNITIGSTAVTGHSYSWTSKPSGFASSVSNPSVNPTVKTTYYMTETITATGCSKTDSAVISINPLPSANAGGNHSICWGDSYQVGGLATSGHTYSWTSKPTGFANTTSNPNVSPTVTTTYYLKETITSTGCSKTDSVVITVNTVKVSAGGNHTICSGSSITLGGSSVSGISYSWSSSPAGYSANSSNPSASPKVKTTYLVIATDAISGCSGADSAVITVNPIPNAVTGISQAVCAGSPVSLGTTATSGNTYSWISKPGGYSSIVSNPTVAPKVTTTYYLTETITATGCSKTDSVKITTIPLPNAAWSMDHFGITTYLHAQDSSLNDTSYHWTLGDGNNATGHLAKHIYPKNKVYNVSLRVSGTNGCTSEYDSTITVTVSSIGFDVKESNELNIYPNPFSSATTIEYNLENASKVNIALMDVTGKQIGVIVDQNQVAGKYQFDINAEKFHLSPGVYFVKFMVNDKVLSRQVVKM
jgi:hypothetical protein